MIRFPRMLGPAAAAAAAVVIGFGAACGGGENRSGPGEACLAGEGETAADSLLLLCMEPPPPVAFTWDVPASVTVPFGATVDDSVGLWVQSATSLTFTVSTVELRCWDGRSSEWIAVPQWPGWLSGADLSCAPGQQLTSPFAVTFAVPADVPVPPGGGLECVARAEAARTTWCRAQFITPPSPVFPVVVEYVTVSGGPTDPAAAFALDQAIAYTGALDGVADDGAEWQQVRLAARAFTLAEPGDVTLGFDSAMAPAADGSTMKLDVRFKLDGYVVSEQRRSAGSAVFEAVVPEVAAGRHVVSVEARGVATGESAGVPVRLTGPAGGDARLEVAFH